MGLAVRSFICLFATVTVAFSVTLAGMQKAGRYHPLGNEPELDTYEANAALFAPWWAVYGYLQPQRYDFLTSALVWIYVLIGSIVLVNLLVAMFADTFARVKESSEQEYIYVQAGRLFQYRSVVHPVPPILNAPLVARDLIYFLFKIVCKYGVCRISLRTKADPDGVKVERELSSRTTRRCTRNSRWTSSSTIAASAPTGTSLASRFGKSKPIVTATWLGRTLAGKLKSAQDVVLDELTDMEDTDLSFTSDSQPPGSPEAVSRPGSPESRPALEMHDAAGRSSADGKNLVDEYLRLSAQREADSLHAVATASRDNVTELASRQGKDFMFLSERVATLERYLAEIKQGVAGTKESLSSQLRNVHRMLANVDLAVDDDNSSVV